MLLYKLGSSTATRQTQVGHQCLCQIELGVLSSSDSAAASLQEAIHTCFCSATGLKDNVDSLDIAFVPSMSQWLTHLGVNKQRMSIVTCVWHMLHKT